MGRHRYSIFLTQMKLIVGFVAFGLLIGYASFFINSVLMGNRILQGENSASLAELILEFTGDGIDGTKSLTRSLELAVPGIRNGDVIVRIFRYSQQSWKLIHISPPDEQAPSPLSDPLVIQRLDNIRSQPEIGKRKLYPGGNSRLEWMSRATDSAGDLIIVNLSIRRPGVFELFRTYRTDMIAYTITLLLLSTLIGALFAWHQSRPLRALSRPAARIASGDYDTRFPTGRKDVLGELSDNLDGMALSLKHNFTAMKAMNSIDRAVLGAREDDDIIAQVASIISEAFGGAGVCILELRGSDSMSGLVVAGIAPSDGAPPDAPGRVVVHDDIPEEMKSDLDTTSLLKGSCREFLSEVLPPEVLKARGLRIPLFISGRLAGVVMISLDDITLRDRDTLARFTDQAGIALLRKRETQKRQALYRGTLNAMSLTVDLRSPWTRGHSLRVAAIADVMARDEYLALSRENRNTLEFGCKLHDIGKISLDPAILDKPGKLNKEEFARVKEHPEIGAGILKDVPELTDVMDIILHHHERWDGTGYPRGLRHGATPLLARVAAIADVFDAITSDRPYRNAMNREDAREFMISGREHLFDPVLLDRFIVLLDLDRIPL